MNKLKDTKHWVNQKEIQHFVVEFKKYPPLSRDQELMILKEMRTGNEEVIRVGKEKLVKHNMRFVVTIAKKYQNQGLSLNDLINEGNLGLVKASHRYDYNQDDIRFLSYAVWWIKQCITESLHLNSRTVRLPANVINETHKSGKEPLAETVHDYTLQFPRVISLDVSIDDDGNTLHEMLKDDNIPSPDNDLDNISVNIKNSLKSILNLLKPNEQKVLIRCFGLDGSEPWTLQDIADEMGKTKERIRQIKEKSLKKIRDNAYHLLEMID